MSVAAIGRALGQFTRRWRLRAIVSILAIVGITIGVPALLWSLVGNPMPAGIPSTTELRLALERGVISSHSLLKGLALICWIAWAQIVVALIYEIGPVRANRRADDTTVPAPRPSPSADSRARGSTDSRTPSAAGRRPVAWRPRSRWRAVRSLPIDSRTESGRSIDEPLTGNGPGSRFGAAPAAGHDDGGPRGSDPAGDQARAPWSWRLRSPISPRLPWRRLRDEPPPAPPTQARQRSETQVVAALATLGQTIDEHGDANVRPRTLHLRDDRIEVVLTAPLSGPPADDPPWGTGEVWESELPPACDVPPIPHPCPLLVPVGRSADGGQYLLDLEAEGLISITGETDAVDALTTHILGHLESGPARVMVIADDPQTSEPLGLSTPTTPWGIAQRRLPDNHTEPAPDTFLARAQRHSHPPPTLLVFLGAPTDAAFEQLCTRVRSGPAGLAVLVVGAHVAGATPIRVHDEMVTLHDLTICAPQPTRTLHTDREDASSTFTEPSPQTGTDPEIAEPTEPVGQPSPGRPDENTPSSVTTPDADPLPPNRSDEHADHGILVCYLGEIRVEGTREALTPKKIALTAYLALHGPVAAEQVEDALWNKPLKSRHHRLHVTISECRTILGEDNLPAAPDGRYQLGPAVRTDLELFEQHLDRSADQEGAETITSLRAALELVTGPVFTYRSADSDSFAWVDRENHISTWEPRVIDAAERLTNLAIDQGDHDQAIWAAQRGLRAAPLDTRLTEALMRAHAAAGKPDAALLVYRSHDTALNDLELGPPAESTQALEQQLRNQVAS